MSLPTSHSIGSPLKDRFNFVVTALQDVRVLAVNQRADLSAGDVSVDTIINRIYKPMVRATNQGGYWNTLIDLAAGKQFRNYYKEQLSQKINFDPAEGVGWSTTTNRLLLDGNEFNNDDPVRIGGPGTPPTGVSKDTNYWVVDKTGLSGIGLAATFQGSKINLTAAGSGSCYLELRVAQDFTTTINAIEAVIDEIISVIPVTPTTLEIRSQKFDKTLSLNSNGLEEIVLNNIQTATLQAKLLDVVNSIEAPV
jgi:hypothetical protein